MGDIYVRAKVKVGRSQVRTVRMEVGGIEETLYDPPASLSRKFEERPATNEDRAVIRALARCAAPPVSSKRRRKK